MSGHVNRDIVKRLRRLRTTAKVAADVAAVVKVISNLIDIVPSEPGLSAPHGGPLSVLVALPVLESLLPEIRTLRVQRGDESVGSEWDAEIELEDGIRLGEGNSATAAILCAIIEVFSGKYSTCESH